VVKSTGSKVIRLGRVTVLLVLGLAVMGALAFGTTSELRLAQAQDTSIAVNTAADEANTDGDCSLREAIQAANSNRAVDACAAGSATEEDSISFDLGPSATITLGSQLPDITDAAGLAIDGGEADITVSGNDQWTVFVNKAILALRNLTVAHGYSADFGGGVKNYTFFADGLTVADSTFSENTAEQEGGAIDSAAELNVTDSTFLENSAGMNGGAINHDPIRNDALTVSGSTFSGNSLQLGFNGGAIYHSAIGSTINNSTFSGNSSRGVSVFHYSGTLTIWSSTFSEPSTADGGGRAIFYSSDLKVIEVSNSIVVGECRGVEDEGANIVWNQPNDDCGFEDAPVDTLFTDPLLDPSGLQDNGGPTMTIALQQQSPAIDAIPEGPNCNNRHTQDQRGVTRPQDGDGDGTASCDIGAFEVVAEERDTTAPDAPVINSPPEGSHDTDGSFTLSGTAEPNSTVDLFDGGKTLDIDTTVDASGDWSVELTGVSEGSHSYTAKATDQAGNVSAESQARTVIVDTLIPSVTSVTPADLAKDVAPGANVTGTFSEKMNASTITAETFKLTEKKSTKPIAAVVSYDPATKKAILDPKADLKVGVTYTAMVASGASDLTGHAFVVNQVWDFTVQK
jgi:CSLREA domain-containing protein